MKIRVKAEETIYLEYDEDKEISKKDWFTSGEISWEEYWNDPSWEKETA